MNWLDILLIILIVIVTIMSFTMFVMAIKENETSFAIGSLIVGFIISGGILACAFLNLDYKSGQTVGEITSVDKNFFGTTAVYIKTTNNQEEQYCVESSEIVGQANKLVGKKVKISYGTRVGFYSTGRCSQAPIDKIELINED